MVKVELWKWYVKIFILSGLFYEIWRWLRTKGFPYLLAWSLEKNCGIWGKPGESGDLLSFITALGHMSTIEPEKFSGSDPSPAEVDPLPPAWWEKRKMGFWTAAVFILPLLFLVFNSLKNRGGGRNCQGKITTAACYFLPPQIFLSVCVSFSFDGWPASSHAC